MSEKRFTLFGLDNETIKDDVTKECYWVNEYVQRKKLVDLLNEQQSTINELQSIINHIKCEENCFDYDYCCETVCSLYNEIRHLKEENEQLKEELNNLKKDETMLYHYYTLARYGGDGV